MDLILKYNSVFYSLTESCKALSVELRNDLLNVYESLQGIYALSFTMDGRSSWVSDDTAVWFNSQHGVWIFGFLGSIGTISHYMYSDPAEFAKDPQDIAGWQYWDHTDSQYKIGSDDITIQCGM